jgi:hypothetical protein
MEGFTIDPSYLNFRTFTWAFDYYVLVLEEV